MELKIDLGAPPQMLCFARHLLTQTLRELHPDFTFLPEGPAQLTQLPAEEHEGVRIGTNAKTGAPLYSGGETEGGKAPEYQPGEAATDSRVDMLGVNFSERHCAYAEEPFYSSGPRKGQWKKRRGVTEEAYDAWYEGELRGAGGADAQTSGQVNTAAAFGNGGAAPSMFKDTVPTDAGALMVWISEKQTAKALTQADIDWAYDAAKIKVPDLFPPNDPKTIANRIATIHGMLVSRGGA